MRDIALYAVPLLHDTNDVLCCVLQFTSEQIAGRKVSLYDVPKVQAVSFGSGKISGESLFKPERQTMP